MTTLIPFVSQYFTKEGICSLLSGIFHIIIGSVFFDLVHYLAHNSYQSSYQVLRLLARTHHVHHQYFDRQLNFNETFRHRNTYHHLTLELLCQIVGSTLSWVITCLFLLRTDLSKYSDLLMIWLAQSARSLVVVWNGGQDSNHVSFSRVPKDPHFLLVGPQYHALHHLDPQHHFGSLTKLLDWAIGTAVTLKGRRVAMTGSRGALGQALRKELSLELVKSIKPLIFGLDWTYESNAELAETLADTDILIIAHGTKSDAHAFKANCESAITLVELFKKARKRDTLGLLPEVWYVGSEAELHGAWSGSMMSYATSKRAFVPFARAYYEDNTFIYRHIVPAAFDSSMGSALGTAQWAAKTALWWIRRGARYVPVTYTGIAYANYFRFMYWVEPRNQLGEKSCKTST